MPVSPSSTAMLSRQQVSVIVAAYNAQHTIARAVCSALLQPSVAQVIVVDDASSDDTVKAAQDCDDGSGRLLILRQTQNAGPSAARNAALKRCSAAWVTILDADDFYLPGRLDGLLAHSDGYDIVADDMFQVDEGCEEGERATLLQPPLMQPRIFDLADFVYSNVTRRGRTRAELGFIKPLIRRQFIIEHDLEYQEHMRLGEDYELYVRLLALGARAVIVPAQGYVSVRRENSLSGMHSIKDLYHLRECNRLIADSLILTAKEKRALRTHTKSIDCRYQWRRLIEAVKTRDIKMAASTFVRPYPVPFYLIVKLAEQLYVRLLRP